MVPSSPEVFFFFFFQKSKTIPDTLLTGKIGLAVLVLALRAEGYGVWVSAETTGTSSIFVRDLANQRMIHAGAHVVSTGSVMTELLSSELPDISEELQVEVRRWIDTYLPTIGSINRAHAHAVQDGVIHPAMKEALSNYAA